MRTTTIVVRSDNAAVTGDTVANFHNRIPALRDLDHKFRYRIVGFGTTGFTDAPLIFYCDLGWPQQHDAGVGGGGFVIGVTQRSSSGSNVYPWIYCDGRQNNELVNIRATNLDNTAATMTRTVIMIEIEPLH
jgi:hypothetical protein